MKKYTGFYLQEDGFNFDSLFFSKLISIKWMVCWSSAFCGFRLDQTIDWRLFLFRIKFLHSNGNEIIASHHYIKMIEKAPVSLKVMLT